MTPFVAAPFVKRPRRKEPAQEQRESAEEERPDALLALRDLDFDFRTDKIAEIESGGDGKRLCELIPRQTDDDDGKRGNADKYRVADEASEVISFQSARRTVGSASTRPANPARSESRSAQVKLQR